MSSQFFLVWKATKEQDKANAAAEETNNGAMQPQLTISSGPAEPQAIHSQPEHGVKPPAALSEIERIAAQPRFKGTSNEYLTLMIQFGCIGFFSTALPIAPFLAMVSNVIELRGDAHKFTHSVRRPPVTHAEGIGTFATVRFSRNYLRLLACLPRAA